MTGATLPFRRRCLSPEEGRAAADRALSISIEEREACLDDLQLDDPETLLCVTKRLAEQTAADPSGTLAEAEFLYWYLDSLEPQYPLDPFRLDEHAYFLGETARLAGTMCRVLSMRDDARRWFDRSEGAFLATLNPSANLAKLFGVVQALIGLE